MDQSNAIMEIRGGTGGDEAKLFAEDLLRMYLRFCEMKNFKLESLDEGVVKIKAKNAFGLFKHESGVHRVQRVPTTESQGRVHTSTASVAVLPEVKPAQVEIREEDLEWKFTRAGGKGGQNVNKVNTAVLLTHTPSGIVVNCRQERSQQQNRMLALDLLRSQLWEIEEEKKFQEVDGERRAAVGRAMRAEKIRTYNYPQNRVTDHRINESWYELDRIMEGDLEKVFATVAEKIEKPLEQTN
jgi:peptide chain release factor 1